MRLYTVSAKLVPTSQHPAYYDIGGAYANLSAVANDEASAVAKVKAMVEAIGWEWHTLRKVTPWPNMTFEDLKSRAPFTNHMIPSSARPLEAFDLHEVTWIGVSVSFFCYRPGEEDSLNKL